MFERYTERARRALFFGRYACSEYGSEAIDTEHLLIGLLREKTGIAAEILRPQRDAVETEIRTELSRRATDNRVPTHVEIPFSAAMRDVLGSAVPREAERMGHDHIGDEHLLLGIAANGKTLAAQTLTKHGLSADVIREAITHVDQSLRTGFHVADRTGEDVVYRYLRDTDDVNAITEMLHEAYAELAAQGLRFVASHQSPDLTRKRMAEGQTIVAECNGQIVGIVTLRSCRNTNGCPFYDLPDVASFKQLAVRPSHQRRGIGSKLLELVERRAVEQGISTLALDTSEQALGLISLYEAKGYRFVEHTQWPDVNYRTVIMAKQLG